MYAGQRVLCLIPARGGSKGLPRKNVAVFGGRPLIAWAVAAAAGSAWVDDVVVTTDDDEIARAAEAAGARVPFRRPAELATDTAHMGDVIAHAVGALGAAGETFGWLLLLQPTAPLRTAAHVDAAFERLAESRGRAVVSVCEAEHNPRWTGHLPPDGNLRTFLDDAAAAANRQELGRYYRLNGSIYLAELDYWHEHGGFMGPETYAYVMPQEASVDVDSGLDLEFAEFLLARRHEER